jgi:hypothetical protein
MVWTHVGGDVVLWVVLIDGGGVGIYCVVLCGLVVVIVCVFGVVD